MNKLKIALLALVLSSCASQKEIAGSGPTVIDFTQTYRDFLQKKNILSYKDNIFINQDEIVLYGMPDPKKLAYFKKEELLEGSWIKIHIKAGTYGKAVKADESTLKIIFSEKYSSEISWKKNEKKEGGEYYYILDLQKDSNPKIPPGIKKLYLSSMDSSYMFIRGVKFYLAEKNLNRLQTIKKTLAPKTQEHNGIKIYKKQ